MTVGVSRESGRREHEVSGVRRVVQGCALLVVGLVLLSARPTWGQSQDQVLAQVRADMVRLQIEAEGVRDSLTLAAMRSVRRHEFVPEELRRSAYLDRPLPIGYGQTISQPYMVGYMTEILEPRSGMKVLEVGTGSGYQAAVLARAGVDVYTMEIIEALATSARHRLGRLGYDNVRVRHADGFDGWPEEAPFDAVIVTAAAGFIPPPLIEQLKPGGRMVIPVGSVYGIQTLILVEKSGSGEIRTRSLLPVRFVPLVRDIR